MALVYPEDSERCNQDYLEQTSKDNRYQLEYRCRHKDGSLFWVIDRGIITSTAEGYNQNQSIITNINPIKENEEKLRMSEARFRIAINSTNAAVFEFDIEQKRYLTIENAPVVFRADEQTVISAFDEVRLYTADIQMADVFRHWFHPEDVPMLQHSYAKVLRGTIGECEVRLRQPNGGYIWCKLHYTMVTDNHGQPIRVIGHLVDIGEQHNQTERLMIEAQSDPLTGLYNKAAIKDLVERIGGDEFVILLQNNCPINEVEKRAEAICDAFRHTYSGEKKDYKISCSVGIALSVVGDSFDSLFHKSDLALYQAKSMGKDQYVVYTERLSRNVPLGEIRINQSDNFDSGNLKIKERIFELLYDSIDFIGSVNMILALLGQLLEASHIYIFENTSDHQFAQSIYEWSAESSTELYNPNSKMWMIANASPIRWSGCDHMKMICCQVINQYKNID